jgi:hypothetical protein
LRGAGKADAGGACIISDGSFVVRFRCGSNCDVDVGE